MNTDTDEYETVELDPPGHARHTVIWLHGLGADGHDFEPIVPELRLPEALAVRFVFPNAPVRAVTLNGGYPMRAWFDLTGLQDASQMDVDGLREAERQVRALIERENARGIPSERIVLAGFSQGGAVALHTAVRYPQTLAGLMALSTFGVTDAALAAEAAPANRALPIFMAHGQQDQVVAPTRGLASRDALVAAGYAVNWHEYSMAHAVCGEEVGDIRAWLLDVLSGAPGDQAPSL